MLHDYFLQPETSLLGRATLAHRVSWKSLLSEPLRSQAQAAALHVAECMCEPEQIQRIAHLTRKQSTLPQTRDLFSPYAAAELALFYSFIARNFSEAKWQKVAQQYLKLTAIASQRYNLVSPSLFGGISGITFTIDQFSDNGRHYQQTLKNLHQSLLMGVRKHLDWQVLPKMDTVKNDFDLISGASGIVGYLVNALGSYADSVTCKALDLLLDYLLFLTEPGQILGQERWFCAPPHFKNKHNGQHYSQGYFDCGLAHGIAGPLAALSLTAIAGYSHPRLRESITYISQWLIQHRIDDEWGTTWPRAIPYELASLPERWHTLQGSRTAWCYGTPGIARSIWLAGLALQEESLMKIALNALKSVFHRPVSMRDINAPTLCHGIAGLLLICLRFAHESQDPFLLTQIPFLVEQILALFNPQSPLGFRNIEPGDIMGDQSALLYGASGTVLTLLAATSEISPSWDRLLLLS